jgi:hypothetical protein
MTSTEEPITTTEINNTDQPQNVETNNENKEEKTDSITENTNDGKSDNINSEIKHDEKVEIEEKKRVYDFDNPENREICTIKFKNSETKHC